MDEYYNEINSNVHRGVHHLSAQATTAYEAARQKVRAPTFACRLDRICLGIASHTKERLTKLASLMVYTIYGTARPSRPVWASQVASFINADSWREIVFTRNASEAVNLVAHAWGNANLRPDDEVVLCAACFRGVMKTGTCRWSFNHSKPIRVPALS